MLYQILTERLPFVGRNPYEVYKKVLEEDPAPPSQIKPSTSPEIEKVCLQASPRTARSASRRGAHGRGHPPLPAR